MVENCFNQLNIWDYSLKTNDPVIFKKNDLFCLILKCVPIKLVWPTSVKLTS